MKLYYAPGACSLAPHIALDEPGLPYEPVKVDLRKHTLPDGTDYYAINPKGYVPLLELDDGTRLTEVAVLLQYIADRKPGTLAPAFGTIERYQLMEWLNFIATEMHKGFGPLWNPETPRRRAPADRAGARQALHVHRETLGEAAVPHRRPRSRSPMRTCSSCSTGPKFLKVDLSPWPALPQFHGARRRAPGRAGGAEGRRPGEVTA